MGGLTSFHQRWEKFKDIENDKVALVENLLGEFNRLTKALDDTERQLEREKETSSLYHQRFRDMGKELQDKQKEMDSNTFVSVLVDGDCMNFLDEYVKDLEHGGQLAAQQLREAVFGYLKKEIPNIRIDMEVYIRVYANMKGISKLYCDANILEKREAFEQFTRTFNMAHPLCDFVDAGSGKECSDDKIRENFKLHVGNLYCKHIIFGGSADNGYARMLGPIAGNESARDRVTMLEGPPFAQELSQLTANFRISKFPQVFRETKIPARRVSFSTTPPRAETPKTPTWASAAALMAVEPATVNTEQLRSETLERSRPHEIQRAIPRNKKGQRVDPALVSSAALVANLKAQKLCNHHHLGGYCAFSNCNHKHGRRLNDTEVIASRCVARLAPCGWGLYCEDHNCFSGHECRRPLCDRATCRFPAEMHNVDNIIVAVEGAE